MKAGAPLKERPIQVVRYYKKHIIQLNVVSSADGSDWEIRFRYSRHIGLQPTDEFRTVNDRYRSVIAATEAGLNLAKAEIDGVSR
ncbi:MAG TPA: hypothetical protein VKZ53_16860 [Candidatus Angelobacter sp.]|nr:hypothetical protein [Candidatus Angelobacter sp.]